MRQLKSRPPAVSGIFYPSNPSELRNPLNSHFGQKIWSRIITTSYIIVGFMD